MDWIAAKVGSVCDQDDVVAVLGEPPPDDSTDCSGAVDHEAHHAKIATISAFTDGGAA